MIRDLPYYNGQPAQISGARWLILVVSVAVGFALLVTLPFPAFPLNIVPAALFTVVPLATLAWATGGRVGALFGAFGIKEFFLALGFALATIVVSVAVGLLLMQFAPMASNAAAGELASGGAFGIAVFMVRSFIQLIGEELLTILPLLAMLWLCTQKFNLSRRVGLTIAVIVSTAWFAAVHLPTYHWNFVQCFGGIGAARLVLTASYLITRKLSVSIGAHIINDWSEFLVPLLLGLAGGHVPIGTAT